MLRRNALPMPLDPDHLAHAARPISGAPTETATRTAFDTATVTTAQLAERVKAVIDDLRTYGLAG